MNFISPNTECFSCCSEDNCNDPIDALQRVPIQLFTPAVLEVATEIPALISNETATLLPNPVGIVTEIAQAAAAVPAALDDGLAGMSVDQAEQMIRRLRGADAGGLVNNQPVPVTEAGPVPAGTTESPTTAVGITSKVLADSSVTLNNETLSAKVSSDETSSSAKSQALSLITLMTFATLMSRTFT